MIKSNIEKKIKHIYNISTHKQLILLKPRYMHHICPGFSDADASEDLPRKTGWSLERKDKP